MLLSKSKFRFPLFVSAVIYLMTQVSACSSTPFQPISFWGIHIPYKIEVVQGNVVTQEMAAQIQPGLGRLQVRDILGSPLLTDIFHADRWDYVFTIKRPGAGYQERQVSVFFNNDVVVRYEADELPSEREFVAAIDPFKNAKNPPPLELTPAQLQALPAPPGDATTREPPIGDTQGTPLTVEPGGDSTVDYPSLESSAK